MMKRKTLFHLGLAVLVLLAALQAVAAETHQIALRFQTGGVRRYNLEEDLTLKFKIPGQGAVEARTEIRAALRQEILRVDQDGTAEISCRMESWQRRTWANGTEVAADPKEKEEILALRIKLRANPKGEVKLLEPTQVPEGIISPEAYADYGSFLPDRPVAVGEEWTKSFNLKMEGIDCPTIVRNRLEKVAVIGKSRVATIGQEFRQEIAEVSIPLEDTLAGQATAAGTFLGAGVVSFDLDAGCLREEACLFQGNLVAKVETQGARMEIPMELELSVRNVLVP